MWFLSTGIPIAQAFIQYGYTSQSKLPYQVTQHELNMASAEEHLPKVQDFQISFESQALL
jgi:hypothetical protein